MPVVKRSRYPYGETVARLQAAIVAGGNTLFAAIDQTAAAASANLSLRPTTLIIFGNPKGGTILMQAAPLAALDLPLKILVWEAAGDVSVAYVSPAEIAGRYDLAGENEIIAAMERNLAGLADSIA